MSFQGKIRVIWACFFGVGFMMVFEGLLLGSGFFLKECYRIGITKKE